MTSVCAVLSRNSSVVHLEVDNRQCFQQSTECFQSTTDAAAFLGALASSGKLDVPYTIAAVFSEYTSYKSVQYFFYILENELQIIVVAPCEHKPVSLLTS